MIKLILVLLSFCFMSNVNGQQTQLLIGTYTNKGNSDGIYVYDFNLKTGEYKLKSTVKTPNPSFLTLSKNNKNVYSVNETGQNSTVSSFNYNKLNGELSYLNQQPTNGADPCYIINDEQNVISANYSGGSITVFGRRKDGSLSAAKQLIQHTGKRIDEKKRQESAHVHQVQFTPDKRYIISTDLGEDQIYIYRYQPHSDNQVLTLSKVIKTNMGSGPRHLTFSKNGKFVYLTHEFNGIITVFNYKNGNLNQLQEISTVGEKLKDKIDGADIHVSPDGKFLYQTNRGDLNSISLFAIGKNGKLSLSETISTLGKGPRNFAIDPSGNHLLVAHQNTNDVVIFNRNSKTGKLTDSGNRINVGVPVCLVFSK